MSVEENIIADLYPHQPIVLDMAEDLIESLSSDNSSKLGRTALSNRSRIMSYASFSGTILEKNSFKTVKGLGVPQLFEEEYRLLVKDRIEEAAVHVGSHLLISMAHSTARLRTHFYTSSNRRYGMPSKIPGKRTSADFWIRETWAPDYAERFAEATVLGINKDIEEIV